MRAAAMRYLSEHGSQEARAALERYDRVAVQQDQSVTSARTLEDLLRSSLTIEEVATALGLSRSRISHRISDRSLYAVSIQGRRHLPRWQFHQESDGGRQEAIPGLAQIVPAIPREMHPLAVETFMTEPLDDLGGQSPVEHLCSYGAVEVIAEWLGALANR